MRKLISLIAAAFAAIIAIPLLGGAAIFGGGTTCVPATATPATTAAAVPGPVASGAPIPALDHWDREQLSNVATILTIGNTKAVPPWGWVVAVATAMQESGLRNLPGGADDSIGLFQQRPSQGWGTAQQLKNPAYQAGKFFDKLLTVDGWQKMPLTQAAQRVQLSAHPDAYAKHTADAIRLVSHVGSGGSWAIPADLEQCLSNCPTIMSSDAADLLRHEQMANGSAGSARPAATKLLRNQETASSGSVLTPPESAAQRPAIAHDQSEPTSQHHGASGAGVLDCSIMTAGTADPAPRNPDGSWPVERCTIRPDPTTGTGCVTPRLLHLIQQAAAAGFPKPGCYRVDDHGEHPKGRACDFIMTSGGEAAGAQKLRGDTMAAWAVANADRLCIEYVIWFRKIWTRAQGWRAYNNPWGGDDPSGWHTNHVHISVQ